MAKKRTTTKRGDMAMPMSMEPSPKQELAWAMERPVEKAVLAHPRTQKLRDVIKSRMMRAAGNGDDEAPSTGRKKK